MAFEKITENLKNMGYEVSAFASKEDAVAYLTDTISGKTIGFGGSCTLQEIGLFEELSKNNEVYWHWAVPAGSKVPDVLSKAMSTDLYFSSVNGIAETGELVNIDGNCNRVASTAYGHQKVYFIIGNNKVASTLEKAIERARNIAAPLNAKRLGKKTPCAVKGDKCYDCNSPDRICRQLSVFWQKPSACAYEIVLIDEPLGY